ncbi:hypothetical protein ENSA7_81230 [Enhygromyxa salina]|uniref:Uncharacterized protein n=1 Tax=Enhygromyxa salina TaxID=215803 RepID=A0A2S9XLG5_9BACT|nr:hypothetical protein ENSA7_81230 [Enhygromyxa salina]
MIIGVVLIGLLGARSDRETSKRRREPASDYLLRPDEAPNPVPPGVEMWVYEQGMDFEVDGERQRVLDFCPGCLSTQLRGVETVHDLTFAEKNKQRSDDPVLIVHVDPETPAVYLEHALAHASRWNRLAFVVETEAGPRVVHARHSNDLVSGLGLFSMLRVEVGARGTTAQWHAPQTGNARAWEINATIGGEVCAEQPSEAAVRAQLADLIAEGCVGAELSPFVHFDRGVMINHSLPSGIVIQTLAALAPHCGADTAPWLLVLSYDAFADACDPKWSGELDDYASFRDEALNRAQLDFERVAAHAQCFYVRSCFGG